VNQRIIINPLPSIVENGFAGRDNNQSIITRKYKTVSNLRFIFNLKTNDLISLQDIAESQNDDSPTESN